MARDGLIRHLTRNSLFLFLLIKKARLPTTFQVQFPSTDARLNYSNPSHSPLQSIKVAHPRLLIVNPGPFSSTLLLPQIRPP